ncbi:MAG TPA: PIN domain-containing protein [Gammaproteobacteria bacterium]|nr:PIN domain-containing protein [Gammaproteobacteria bacterium]
MASLVDTNVLVYCFDPRHPAKQARARELLRDGLRDDSVVLAHQCIVEFVAAVTRPRPDLAGAPLLPLDTARLEAEQFVDDYRVLYPDVNLLLTALSGTAMYGLSWFDAHLWAYAEANGVAEILSEDFEHGRHYGTVRVVNPFLPAEGVHELPPLYAAKPGEEKSAARRHKTSAKRSAGPATRGPARRRARA